MSKTVNEVSGWMKESGVSPEHCDTFEGKFLINEH